MKTKLSLILGGLILLTQAAMAQSTAPQTFTVSASVPLATSIGITVSSVTTPGNVFTVLPAGTTALSFDPMTFNTTNKIYLPNHYFALDIAAISGAGAPDTTLTYTEGTNPNGVTNGMGFKTTATFDKEVFTSTTTPPAETLLPEGKKRLIDLVTPGLHVPFTEVTGGWLRVYLGVWTGSTTVPADPTNGQPFSNGDAAGTYNGLLLVTAVVN